jgi:glucosyl-dolichyl phosphate glucuronosyltransferase
VPLFSNSNPSSIHPDGDGQPIAITVILCTYNRCESLARALQSLAESQLPESTKWEVLVVDNNSNDQTRDVVQEFCRKYPTLCRYVHEPEPGKSRALNNGICAARGDILAFIDDDVTVAPTWLQNVTSVLGSGEWAGVGGRVFPARDFVLPPWLSLKIPYAFGPLALFDRGSQNRPLDESPIGTNMAYRKVMFEKHGNFRNDLGPKAGSRAPQKCEDSEFGRRLLDAGERLWYEPTAIVYHEIPESRVRKEYFLEWWFDKARSDIRASGIPTGTKWVLAGVPISMVRRLATWTVRWMVAVEPSRRFLCKINVWWLSGGILETYRESRNEKPESPRSRD